MLEQPLDLVFPVSLRNTAEIVGCVSQGPLDAVGENAVRSLSSAEFDLISHAVPKRQQEFAITRLLAHRALDAIGRGSTSIGRDSQGAPLWPPSVAGALTHCENFRAAVVSPSASALGIDAEPARRLPPGVMRSIADARELSLYGRGKGMFPEIPLETVLFSAKESLYKAWYPLTRRWLGFTDAEVTLEVTSMEVEGPTPDEVTASGVFRSVIHSDVLAELTSTDTSVVSQNYSAVDAIASCLGHWAITHGLIVTGLVIV